MWALSSFYCTENINIKTLHKRSNKFFQRIFNAQRFRIQIAIQINQPHIDKVREEGCVFTLTEDLARSSQWIASVQYIPSKAIGRIVWIIEITIKYIGRFLLKVIFIILTFWEFLSLFQMQSMAKSKCLNFSHVSTKLMKSKLSVELSPLIKLYWGLTN